jgi:hypothetical protein
MACIGPQTWFIRIGYRTISLTLKTRRSSNDYNWAGQHFAPMLFKYVSLAAETTTALALVLAMAMA